MGEVTIVTSGRKKQRDLIGKQDAFVIKVSIFSTVLSHGDPG